MGWKSAKSSLGDIVEGVVPGKDLDMAARRVLTGLGLTERGLGQAELTIAGVNYYDETLWSRACRLWLLKNRVSELLRLEVASERVALAEASNLMIQSNTVHVYRSGMACYAVFTLSPDIVVDNFQPPFAALTKDNRGWLIKMELSEFVKQSTND